MKRQNSTCFLIPDKPTQASPVHSTLLDRIHLYHQLLAKGAHVLPKSKVALDVFNLSMCYTTAKKDKHNSKLASAGKHMNILQTQLGDRILARHLALPTQKPTSAYQFVPERRVLGLIPDTTNSHIKLVSILVYTYV